MIQTNFNGIDVREFSILPKGQMVHYKERNILFVPEDGTFYTLIFIEGVTDKAVDFACDYMKTKMENFINSRIEHYFKN